MDGYFCAFVNDLCVNNQYLLKCKFIDKFISILVDVASVKP